LKHAVEDIKHRFGQMTAQRDVLTATQNVMHPESYTARMTGKEYAYPATDM
jgi:hypothetical protein